MQRCSSTHRSMQGRVPTLLSFGDAVFCNPKMIALLIIISLTSLALGAPITCRGENNEAVDWFVAYKLPQIKGHTDANVAKGLGYIFITSASVANGWELSPRSTNDSQSIMGYTLAPMYNSEEQNVARILYNDEPPHDKTTFSLGHTKGVVLVNSVGGIWMIHSVPHYPPEHGFNYSYPSTGIRFGQSFLCISLSTSEMNIVGRQLMYNEPLIYDTAFPLGLKALLPTLASAASGAKIQSPPWYHSAKLSSGNGNSFVSYAKSAKFGKDLYADWVAAEIKSDLLVQSWPNGPGRMPSECKKPFKVENIEALTIMNVANFTTHRDHSKWAAAETDSLPWVCIGDINRMAHQTVRGGGTVCLENKDLWKAYRHTVQALDLCPLHSGFSNNRNDLKSMGIKE